MFRYGYFNAGASIGRKIPAPILILPEELGGPRGVVGEGAILQADLIII